MYGERPCHRERSLVGRARLNVAAVHGSRRIVGDGVDRRIVVGPTDAIACRDGERGRIVTLGANLDGVPGSGFLGHVETPVGTNGEGVTLLDWGTEDAVSQQSDKYEYHKVATDWAVDASAESVFDANSVCIETP
jgi:hypothetical protein